MIKANELRLGNWVKIKEGYCKIRTIEAEGENETFSGIVSNDDDSVWARISTSSSQPIEPIPLTPEWLERFGFSRENRMYYKDAYFISMPIPRGECGFGIKNTIGIIATFQYVHQLQNLYFALQKIELK